MRHPFLEDMAARLARRSVGTFRYEFPYMSAGRRRPDPPASLKSVVAEAVEEARGRAGGRPVLAGGKSMGGRMTSLAVAEGVVAGLDGLVFLGFPLHPPGKPGTVRAEHLDAVEAPMLFVQGTRDTLADEKLVRGVCRRLGARATLHVVDGGDHSFKVLKRSGRAQEEVMAEVADAVADWAGEKF